MTATTSHLALALSAFLSATLLPGSSEAVLLATVAQMPESIYSLLTVATVANVLGSCVNYALGRGLAGPVLTRLMGQTPAALIKAEAWFQRAGQWSLLLAWVPVVGDPLTVVAGGLKIPFWHFLLLVSLGKATRYAALVFGLSLFN